MQNEINELRHKCTMLEKQLGDYRLQCERLNANVDAVKAEVGKSQKTAFKKTFQASEERQSHARATDALERESIDRAQLEKRLQDAEMRATTAERNAEKLELQLVEYRNLTTAHHSDDSGDDETKSMRIQELKQHVEALQKQHEQEKVEMQDRAQAAKKKMEIEVI